MTNYRLKRTTTEIWTATCKECGRPFSSDVRSKAIAKVMDHIRDKHER